MSLAVALWVILVAVITALVVVFLVSGKMAIAAPKRTQKLGDPTYNIKSMSTPVATGTLLRLLAWILADSPLGPLIRRVLLNDENNGSALLQDLALQACDSPGHFALYHPMQRLSNEERARHVEAAKVVDLQKVLQSGFATAAVPGPYLSVEDYARAYRTQKWTPTQALERLLQSIKELQPKFKPFVAVHEEDARAQAKESERRLRAKEPRSLFEGVPVAIKDMIRVKGYRMTEGSVWPAGDDHNVPAEKDNNIVRLFREAGAVIVGTTAMTEFGVTPLGYSAHHQGPFNAYNAKHYSLGSSSGSAAAVALGLVPVAYGADAGGSIRLPAAAQGVFGLATTYGRVADDSPHVTHGSMQKSGPITATARDAALAYAVMGQEVPGHFYSQLYGDPGLPPLHLKDFSETRSLRGVRLGIFWDYFNDAEVPILQSCRKAVEALEALGAEVVPIAIPHLRSLQVAHGFVVSVEITQILGDLLYNKHQLEPSTRIQLALGTSMAGPEIQAGNILRGWALQYLRQEIFKKMKISAIITPTLAMTPPAIPKDAFLTGESNTTLLIQLMKYIFLGNLCGFPGLSIPVGYDDTTGIPIGLHACADHWDEAVLLRLGEVLEGALDQRKTPPSFVDLLGKS
ncbi:unnamed protein product [Durusdinium trenchii]|uniref:Uncharacterized protein n=2 Tax=Durusdinium trenchii TaxID=1381693 RepID=A0ABP0SE95_9DINO